MSETLMLWKNSRQSIWKLSEPVPYETLSGEMYRTDLVMVSRDTIHGNEYMVFPVKMVDETYKIASWFELFAYYGTNIAAESVLIAWKDSAPLEITV